MPLKGLSHGHQALLARASLKSRFANLWLTLMASLECGALDFFQAPGQVEGAVAAVHHTVPGAAGARKGASEARRAEHEPCEGLPCLFSASTGWASDRILDPHMCILRIMYLKNYLM